MDDPVCVKSRTEYVIMVMNCPVMWQTKLQSETALSTMEAKMVALVMASVSWVKTEVLLLAIPPFKF